jgi:hypothetical protein
VAVTQSAADGGTAQRAEPEGDQDQRDGPGRNADAVGQQRGGEVARTPPMISDGLQVSF